MEDLKFTQEVKDKWLEALRSGKYVQHDGELENNNSIDKRYCCIGVLGKIHPKLDNNSYSDDKSPYMFLQKNIGYDLIRDLWWTNDKLFNPNKPDYSNVIPLIECLPVQE